MQPLSGYPPGVTQNIMRSELGAPRRTKELFESFDCGEAESTALVHALRAADRTHWYWVEAGEIPVVDEPARYWYGPELREKLASATPEISSQAA